jgi:hypothetical protein
MRPRCAVPAGEPPGELAACNCACKMRSEKTAGRTLRGRSAAQASTRLAAPTAVRSWLDSRTLHRQPIAQTKDTTVSSKFPASCPAWYFHSWVGASIEIDTLGVKKRSHSSRSSAGGALTISSPSGELGAPKRMCTAGFAQLASQPCRAEGRHNVLMNMTRSGDP